MLEGGACWIMADWCGVAGHKRNCDKTWNYRYYALPMSKPEWGSQQTPLQVVTTW